MSRLPHLAVLACLAVGAACNRAVEDPAAETAFNALVKALDDRDSRALWAMANDETRAYFGSLVRDIRAATEAIDSRYPGEDRPAARKAVGADILGPITTGEELFRSVLDPTRLVAPADPAARKVAKIFVTGAETTVITEAGEMLGFTRDSENRYRTGLFLKSFKEMPAIATLEANLVTVRQNAAILAGPADAAGTAPGPTAGGQK